MAGYGAAGTSREAPTDTPHIDARSERAWKEVGYFKNKVTSSVPPLAPDYEPDPAQDSR